jgi:hypothetical protein
MLVPQHPRPVGRRRAVAEMTVAAKQAAAIEPGHVLVVPAAPAGTAGPAASESPPVSPDRHDTPF